MAQVINSTDYLTFILTQYGLNRVGEALANPNEDLNISKIKVGDANFTYYEPTETQPDLIHIIEGGEFYIIDKELLEDNLTVSFHAIFPETFQNAEIREVGIYETIDGWLDIFRSSFNCVWPYISFQFIKSYQ
jgi:phage-related tail fiber protein